MSTWQLDLPKDFPAFDHASISDVVLHIRFTARQGVVASNVVTALEDLFQQTVSGGPNFSLLFALQRDFPAGRTAFAAGQGPFQATVRRGCLPVFHSRQDDHDY